MKNLRKMKARGTELPNIKSKFWAVRIQDDLSDRQAIKLPEETEKVVGTAVKEERETPLQSSSLSNYSIVGTDVEALFPSLQDIEVARVAREAVLLSKAEYRNVNCDLALRYLKLA